jgi:paraquat-inducible protein A
MHQRKTASIQRTLALLITASILYIPANILPIMITDQLGSAEPSTILGGVVLLIKLDSVPIAAIIFIASVMVPLCKFFAFYYLCWSVENTAMTSPRQNTTVYRMAEFVGKWSMVDVFVVAILVALVNLGGLVAIKPGAAALAFACVVIITMVAAESFDPRLMWDKTDKNNE